MRDGKIVWITAIPGVTEKATIKKVENICAERGKKINSFDVGPIMEKIADITDFPNPRHKMLDAPEDLLNALRAAAFERILGEIKYTRHDYDAILINTHTAYHWKQILKNSYSVPYLKAFDPDLFICYIDAAERILKRLNQSSQWRGQKFQEHEIWRWENEVYNITKTFPKWLDKKKAFYTIPIQQPDITLYHLIFEPHRPIVYAQSPMTHIIEKYGNDERAKELIRLISNFNNELWKRFIVFDPWAIETGGAKLKLSKDEYARHIQTVNRDLFWYIGQSDLLVAYFPEIVATFGVPIEMKEGIDTGKDCFVIWPSGDVSPFLLDVEPENIFRNQKRFFNYIDKVYLPNHYKKIGYKP